MAPRKLPKFLYSKSTNTVSAGEYIIHTMHPRCVGIIWKKDKQVRVYMHEKWEEMDAETEKKLCLDMKNWYYFGQYKEEEANTITGLQRDNPLSIHLLQSVFFINHKKLVKHKNMTPEEFMQANEDWLQMLAPQVAQTYKHTITRKEARAASELFLSHYPF